MKVVKYLVNFVWIFLWFNYLLYFSKKRIFLSGIYSVFAFNNKYS